MRLVYPNSKTLVSFLYDLPIHNPPQRLQVRGTAVLVVEVVGVLPDVEGEEGAEAADDGVRRPGLLRDDEGAVGGGGEPDPAGAEEGDAFGDEVGLEGVEGAPLLDNLFLQMPGRAGHDVCAVTPDLIGGLELREVQVVVQDLAGVVEDGGEGAGGGAHGGREDDFLQRHGLELGPVDEAVQVLHIAAEVLAVVEFQGLRADGRRQSIDRIGKLDQSEHGVWVCVDKEEYISHSSPNKRLSKECSAGPDSYPGPPAAAKVVRNMRTN